MVSKNRSEIVRERVRKKLHIKNKANIISSGKKGDGAFLY